MPPSAPSLWYWSFECVNDLIPYCQTDVSLQEEHESSFCSLQKKEKKKRGFPFLFNVLESNLWSRNCLLSFLTHKSCWCEAYENPTRPHKFALFAFISLKLEYTTSCCPVSHTDLTGKCVVLCLSCPHFTDDKYS